MLRRNKTSLKTSFCFFHRELLQKPDGTWRKAGDIITNTKLASTLKAIQADPNSYYTGTIANEIVLDTKESGGIISHEDLKNYKVKEREPLETVINGLKFYLMPPPGSGAVNWDGYEYTQR